MSSVEEYIVEQSSPLREMMQKLHAILLSCTPQMEAKLTYKIPFYSYFGRLCYLNPKSDRLDLGFCKGALLDENPLLSRFELKEVRIITFKHLADISETDLRPLIFEAMILNELTKKKTKPRSNFNSNELNNS